MQSPRRLDEPRLRPLADDEPAPMPPEEAASRRRWDAATFVAAVIGIALIVLITLT
jgi:predicted cobalt transporter CbtA